jgi:4-hydroxy-3-polyprenylbenzoate decarboxylase
VVGITGATGAVYGVRALEALRALGVETHLVMSKWGQRTVEHETPLSVRDVRALATESHGAQDQAAAISSGSFPVDAMLVAPCSMRSLAAIRHGLSDNLLTRAADVTLKERRPLVLLARETPLSPVHLENMLALARLGVAIVPPVPAFYNHPDSIDALVDHTVARALDQLGLDPEWHGRWTGTLTRLNGKVTDPSS